jgi:hypothetical protein
MITDLMRNKEYKRYRVVTFIKDFFIINMALLGLLTMFYSVSFFVVSATYLDITAIFKLLDSSSFWWWTRLIVSLLVVISACISFYISRDSHKVEIEKLVRNQN